MSGVGEILQHHALGPLDVVDALEELGAEVEIPQPGQPDATHQHTGGGALFESVRRVDHVLGSSRERTPQWGVRSQVSLLATTPGYNRRS